VHLSEVGFRLKGMWHEYMVISVTTSAESDLHRHVTWVTYATWCVYVCACPVSVHSSTLLVQVHWDCICIINPEEHNQNFHPLKVTDVRLFFTVGMCHMSEDLLVYL
jgi:hypothetical protein